MDWEGFVSDVWESVNESLFTEQVVRPDGVVVTIGETWLGALYGTEENEYGQRVVRLFESEGEQRDWFDAVTMVDNDRDATALVVNAIEAGAASASEFDVDAIVADLYGLAGGWDFRTVDHDGFWLVVERHAREV